MNRQKAITRIGELLARFSAEVSNLNNENLYDINIHAENVLVPILNKVYGVELVNANKKEKNAAAIDLIDSKNRICFQVTSSSDSEKVKHTLRQFKKHNKDKHFDTLFIYIITQKQKGYTGKGYDDILDGAIHFDKDQHIIDNSDLLSKVNNWYALPQINEVLELLELEFSEEKIEKRRDQSESKNEIRTDRIYSNLLELKPQQEFYIAELNFDREAIIKESWETEYKLKMSAGDRKVIHSYLQKMGAQYIRDFHVYGKKIITFRDINTGTDPLIGVINYGTIEKHNSQDFWEESESNQRAFSELLKYSFEEKMVRKGIRFSKKEGLFHYMPSKKSLKKPRTLRWKHKKFASRTVVKPTFKDSEAKKKEILHLKHQAFYSSIRFLNNHWYILINPTWLFTYDGFNKSRYNESNLKGAKRLENNQSVRNSVLSMAYHFSNEEPKENKYEALGVETPDWGELTFEIESK